MLCDPNGAGRLNSFALVTYILGPVGSFVDQVRTELVPSWSLQAHVTILPPRPLAVSCESAWEQIERAAGHLPAFEVEATGVRIFPATQVIYLALGAGDTELRRMHDLLSAGDLACAEAYSYHPHITLAQGMPLEGVERTMELARRRWSEFKGNPTFVVDRLTFVQGTRENTWLDLASGRLEASIATH